MVQPGAETLPIRKVLGIPVALVSMDQAVSAIRQLLKTENPDLIFTADSQGIYLAQKDPDLKVAYETAAFNTPDSNGVVWALGKQGVNQKRVTGVDLAEKLLAVCAEDGHPVFFLGAAPGIAREAAERMVKRYPNLKMAGCRDGFWASEEESEVVAEIAAAGAHLVLVALGIPRQEKFLMAHREQLGFRAAMGVGGSFDVWSGRVKRAPKIIQALRAEWLWRVLLNPKKISKVATLPRFAIRVLKASRH
ncbi:MAG: WecB/TagA/CpsF family glycosyltransferase [Fimbriimonadaceae bacterium]|nr:WecB/TagA/CpsF family glycosyltransferase [Fimbriimonadaceae bacterium]